MFSNSAPNQDVIIAGQHSGKPVTIVPTAKPVYDQLAKLARDGNNYWAEITVKAINELAAGRLHQSNIFVKPGAVHRNGTEEFVMILPGCKVTCEKLDADGFRILHFEADIHYGEAIKAKAKPGLYTAKKNGSEWKTKRSRDGAIQRTNDRLVAICDSGYANLNDAAETAAPRISDAPMSGGSLRVNNNGFDPMFNEVFKFHVSQPSQAVLTFEVRDDDTMGSDFIAQGSCPLVCAQQGVRKVTLADRDGTITGPFQFASLFVDIRIEHGF